jgi:hypothetical protein
MAPRIGAPHGGAGQQTKRADEPQPQYLSLVSLHEGGDHGYSFKKPTFEGPIKEGMSDEDFALALLKKCPNEDLSLYADTFTAGSEVARYGGASLWAYPNLQGDPNACVKPEFEKLMGKPSEGGGMSGGGIAGLVILGLVLTGGAVLGAKYLQRRHRNAELERAPTPELERAEVATSQRASQVDIPATVFNTPRASQINFPEAAYAPRSVNDPYASQAAPQSGDRVARKAVAHTYPQDGLGVHVVDEAPGRPARPSQWNTRAYSFD